MRAISKSMLLLPALAVAALLVLPAAAQATIAYVKYGRYPLAPVVFAASDNGFDSHPVGRGTDPQVSPDGRWVAFLSQAAIPGLKKLKVVPAGGGRSDLLMVGRGISSVTWSPDSSAIAAVSGLRRHRDKLVVIDIPSGGRRIVARGVFRGLGFSPDGEQVIYARARRRSRRRADIFRVSTAGGRPGRLTYDGRSMHPLWGPDDEIAFVKTEGAHHDDVFLMAPDGGRVIRVTRRRVGHAPRRYRPVDWSADGERLLTEFKGRHHSDYAVLIDFEAGALWPLERPKKHFVGVAISAGGEEVLGSSGATGPAADHLVGTVAAGGGRMHVLAQYAYEPSWSS
jgi:dipeptidyl aminopeptidase/acylaminoacyl peptidase